MFKRNKIVKLVSNNKFLVEEFPIEKYSKEPPKWFKDIHVNLHEYTKNTEHKSTVKACAGIWDFLKNAYIIRWNFDLEINISENEKFDYSPVNNNMLRRITWFDKELYAMHTPISDNKLTLNTIKLELNWSITSQQRGKVLFTEPFFDYNRDYRIIPGIVEPKFVSDVNVIIEPVKEVIEIKRGEPALALIPLDNQKIITAVSTQKELDIIGKSNYKQDTLGSGWYEKFRRSDNKK